VGAAPGERPEVVRDRLQQRMPEVMVFTRQQLHEMELRYFDARAFQNGTLPLHSLTGKSSRSGEEAAPKQP